MKKEQFKEGTIIKGRDLKGYTLCMILPEDMVICGFQYNMGENDCDDGSYFCFIKDICRNLQYIYRTVPGCTQVEYGSKLAIVSIPDNEDVCVGEVSFRTHKLKIERVMSLGNVETWEYLHESGADIISDKAIQCAANNGHLNVVKYLHENGADIEKDDNNNALGMAARNGHLEVVKYLHENGADVNKGFALEAAVGHTHMDIVKYLCENGADVNEHCGGLTLLRLVEYGEVDVLDILKYLHENGLDIMMADGAALGCAVCADRLDLVKYLYEHRTEGVPSKEKIEDCIEGAKMRGYLDIAEYLQKQSMQN